MQTEKPESAGYGPEEEASAPLPLNMTQGLQPISHASHAKAIAITVIVLIVAVGVMVYVLRSPSITAPITIPPTSVTVVSTISPAPQVPTLNISEVLYSVHKKSDYINVKNNTWTIYNNTYGFTETASNYALNFTLPIIAPSYMVPVNTPIIVPNAYIGYRAPTSSQLSVYVFNQTETANSFYANNLYDGFKSLVIGTNVTTTLNQNNTSAYMSFTFTAQPVYNSILITRVILYHNYIIYGTGLGVLASYNISYLYNITGNMLHELGGPAG